VPTQLAGAVTGIVISREGEENKDNRIVLQQYKNLHTISNLFIKT
jgi:hypothetical protein